MTTPIIVFPHGGLANKMRVVDSSIALCRRSGRPLRLIWCRNPYFPARFDELFEPLAVPNVCLADATWIEHLAYDAPSRRNLKLPALYQYFAFGKKHKRDEVQIRQLIREGSPLAIFSPSSRLEYVRSTSQMTPTEDRFAMFRPLPEIQKAIDAVVRGFAGRRVCGVHIRRGDHAQAIRNSPIELFVEKMKKALDAGECDTFYLATDCEDTRLQIKTIFGSERIITASKPTSRTTLSGTCDAVAELWILAATSQLIGSDGSTYAETAAWMGNRPYEVLTITSVGYCTI